MKNIGLLLLLFFMQNLSSFSTRESESSVGLSVISNISQTYLSNNTRPLNYSSHIPFTSNLAEGEDEDQDENENENDIHHAELVNHFKHKSFFFAESKSLFQTHKSDLSQAFINQIFSPPEMNS
ncbi:hypothetical protein V7S76_00425 [Aquirufa sp. ROCK2-A2]